LGFDSNGQASERHFPAFCPTFQQHFHALRLRVGDEVFFEILRTYTERYRYGNASTADFIAVAEEVSGQDLGEFFDAWLYAEDIPAIPEMELEP
jgi:aminopeptidase N